MKPPRESAAPPAHPDAQIVSIDTPFSRFLRVDVVRFRHKLFSGEWSGDRVYDVLRRGDAVAVILYDPEREIVVLVEQFRLPALYAGLSPWQIEPVAGLVDQDESYEEVARRECQEEAAIEPIGGLVPIQRYMPSPGDSVKVPGYTIMVTEMDGRRIARLRVTPAGFPVLDAVVADLAA